MAKLTALLDRERFSLWAPVDPSAHGKPFGVRYAETEAALTLMLEEDGIQYVLAGTEPRKIHQVFDGQPEPDPVFVEVVIESRVSDVAERLSPEGQLWLAQRINSGVRTAQDVLADAKPTCPIDVPVEVAIGEATNALFAVALGRDRSTDGWPDGAAVKAFIAQAVASAIRHYLSEQFEAMKLQAESARDHLTAAQSTIRAAYRKAEEELGKPFSTPTQQHAAVVAVVQTMKSLCERLET